MQVIKFTSSKNKSKNVFQQMKNESQYRKANREVRKFTANHLCFIPGYN